jgi:hypothetical protein
MIGRIIVGERDRLARPHRHDARRERMVLLVHCHRLAR